MEFRTKLDYSSNRQIKQYPETFTVLSGGTRFGVPFSALTTGPDLTTSGVTITVNGVVSTFSGNSGTTVYTWYDPTMVLGYPYLSAWTSLNSGTTQNTGIIFSANNTTIIDGNTVATSYSGISFDLTPITVVNLGGGIYSGSVYTDVLRFYSANTLDFTGRTIWVDVSGITRTEKLIITNVGAGPSTIDIGVDATGFVVNQASDARLKENIEPIDNALDKVLKLNGVTFNWVDKIRGGNDRKIGLIAQDVKKVIPELVGETPDGYLTVNYKDIPALLVEAIKQLVKGKYITNNVILQTQTISAEDNNIVLNFNGNHQSALKGGIIVNDGIKEGANSEFITDENGSWTTNCSLKPKSLIIPKYTPLSSNDTYGINGDITSDNNYLYVKNNNKWMRIKLEDF